MGVSFASLARPAEFDLSYLVQLTGPELQITLFISREDEQGAMQKLGLLRGE